MMMFLITFFQFLNKQKKNGSAKSFTGNDSYVHNGLAKIRLILEACGHFMMMSKVFLLPRLTFPHIKKPHLENTLVDSEFIFAKTVCGNFHLLFFIISTFLEFFSSSVGFFFFFGVGNASNWKRKVFI